jgi:hypothetical protein
VRFELALEKEREEPEEEEEVRILLVEDHVTVREALASAFEQEEAGLEVVGQAASLAEARQLFEGWTWWGSTWRWSTWGSRTAMGGFDQGA